MWLRVLGTVLAKSVRQSGHNFQRILVCLIFNKLRGPHFKDPLDLGALDPGGPSLGWVSPERWVPRPQT